MTAEVAPTDQYRVGKAYTVWHAAKLAGVTTRTAREWLLGHEGPDGYTPPVFGDDPEGGREVYEPVRPIRVVAFQGSPHPGPTERSGDLPVKAPAEDS